MQLATRFRLLLLHDIAWFLFFFACCLSDERVAKFVGMILLILAGQASRYAQRMIGTMTLQQMRIRAGMTVIRYLALSAFVIWIDFTWDRDYPHRAPPGAGSILVVPILLIFCYVQVRTQLGLEPLMPENEPKPPNQSMELTETRRTTSSSITSTVSPAAERGPGLGSSSCSR